MSTLKNACHNVIVPSCPKKDVFVLKVCENNVGKKPKEIGPKKYHTPTSSQINYLNCNDGRCHKPTSDTINSFNNVHRKYCRSKSTRINSFHNSFSHSSDDVEENELDLHVKNVEEDELDLHGKNVDESVRIVDEQIESYRQVRDLCRSTSLLIITGRGNHSPGGIPKIKNAVKEYFQRRHIYPARWPIKEVLLECKLRICKIYIGTDVCTNKS